MLWEGFPPGFTRFPSKYLYGISWLAEIYNQKNKKKTVSVFWNQDWLQG